MPLPIALQLYSVRNDASKDLMGVLDQVAAMGYDGVEFAGYYGYEPEAIRAKLDVLGLKAEGTHTGIAELAPERFENTVALHKILGCEYVIIPWMPKEKRNTAAACEATCAELTELTKKLEDVGLRLGFHAHGDDMDVLDNGKTAYHMLGEGTPDSFIMQYDTANGTSGGADPVQPIRDFPGRNVSLHLKGYSKTTGHGALIGEDDIPWKEVFAAAENGGGTVWYVIEHEDETIAPLEAVKICLDNVRKMLAD
jgi:sugar phosphate isomerase/epimerase